MNWFETVLLHEGFGTPVDWTVTKQTDTHFEARFRIKPVIYDVSLFRYDRRQDAWELSFTARTKQKDYGFEASGTGNAWTVFGTVIAIARQFISRKRPGTLKIESDITKRARAKVNLRLAQAIAQDLPYTIEDEHYHIFLHRLSEP
jgi:hypothetical protein